MEHFIDFSNCTVNPLKWFGGANGNKISINYQGIDYMLKFESHPHQHPESSYTNSWISEYVACHILQSLGIPAQETLLGCYRGKNVVACRDFETNGDRLQDFASLKNTIVDSERSGYGTELSEIILTFESQQLLPANEVSSFFWDVFVADALVGNFDRHNGNWGFLTNVQTGMLKLAPVYDCGSCLYPQLSDAAMADVLANPEKMEERIYVFPTSAIKESGKKINYMDFLSQTQVRDCLEAVIRIVPRVKLERLYAIVEETPALTTVQRTFYKEMLAQRKEKILDRALSHALEVLPQKKLLQERIADAGDRAAKQNHSRISGSVPELERE